MRVCSQWFERRHRTLFRQYLMSKGITVKEEVEPPRPPGNARLGGRHDPARVADAVVEPPWPPGNARFRGIAIGDVQNSLVRRILGNLGEEAFTEKDWLATKKYFGNRCAYCDEEKPLELDHAMPINKEHLGEHRHGNLIPTCRICNARKRGVDFRSFLKGDNERIERILAYMKSRNYVPLGDNEQIRKALEFARKEVAAVAEKHIRIINQLLTDVTSKHE